MSAASVRAVLIALAVAWPFSAGAQILGAPMPGYKYDPGVPADAIPRPIREIGFDQHLDAQLPLDVEFRDEEGRSVKVGEYFGRRPVVLAFVYFDCPMLCPMVLGSITSAVQRLPLTLGEDFELVIVSFDARETPELAAERKRTSIGRSMPAHASGAHFLTGGSASIERLAHASGFRFVWDEPSHQFAHPSGIVVVTPDGRIARYLFGIDYPQRDLRLALVEASAGTIGALVDTVLLYCYHYDPTTGRYGLVVMRLLRIAGVATVLGIAAAIVIMVRQEKRANRAIGARRRRA
jgi:protein SCO1/2